jgi:hypothetical protein
MGLENTVALPTGQLTSASNACSNLLPAKPRNLYEKTNLIPGCLYQNIIKTPSPKIVT